MQLATPIGQHQLKEKAHCLLIKHSDGWNDDRCERWLHQHGNTSETFISLKGKPLPEVEQFSHVVIYGGMACVKDADHIDCLRQELHFIEQVLSHNIPCLGICLGAQLIAHVLGSKVKPLPCGTFEFGFSVVKPTTAGNAFMQHPINMLQWHHEGFDLPSDSILLATGDVFHNQAYRHGDHTYGLQFHPEVTPEILKLWHTRYLQNQNAKTDQLSKHRQCAQQLADFHRYAKTSNQWFDEFMGSWVNQAVSI